MDKTKHISTHLSASSPEEPQAPRIASDYIKTYLEMAEALELDLSSLLKNTHIDVSTLNKESYFYDMSALDTLLSNTHKNLHTQYLGLSLGAKLNVSSHGIVGYAGLTASTLRESMLLAIRYMPLINNIIMLSAYEDEHGMHILFDSNDQSPQQVQQFMLQTLVSSVNLMLTFLLEEPPRSVKLFLHQAASNEFKQHFKGGLQLNFNSEQQKLLVPTELCNRQLALANPQAREFAIDACEKEISSLLKQQENHKDKTSEIIHTLALILGSQWASPPSINDAAQMLNISSRTLNRHLSKKGSSYRKELEKELYRRAKTYLNDGLSITHVSYTLGYSEPGNFTRFFKRMSGESPSKFIEKR